MQGFDPALFGSYLGYANGEEDVLLVEEGDSGHAFITTPNVVAAARDHLGCEALQGAQLENFGGAGTAGGHWEERLFSV